jgi:hypothetical protein
MYVSQFYKQSLEEFNSNILMFRNQFFLKLQKVAVEFLSQKQL